MSGAARVGVGGAAAAEFCPQFKALLDKEGVAQEFHDWLKTPEVGVLTVRAFAACATSKEKVDTEIIQASGIAMNFGQKVKVRLLWESATAMANSGQGSSPGGAPSGSQAKMPTGTEALLRKDWKTRHNFNLSGGWLCSEDTMAKVYTGLNADHPYLFIPDISAIIRRSNLSQKTAKSGTLITSEGVQQVDCTLDPCTNHPEFYLRMRA